MECAPDNCFDFATMSDDDLRETIEDQENLVARTPSMASYLKRSLHQCNAELERRLDAQIDKAVSCLEPEAPAYRSLSTVTNTYQTPVKKVTFARAPDSLGERKARARTAPIRFSDEAEMKPEDYGPLLTEGEQTMAEALETMQQLRERDDATIRANAVSLMCPLLRIDEEAAGTFNEHSLKCLLRTQMTRVALADDGHKYDFTRLKKYIRANTGRELLSPITKRPMSSQVQFTAVERDKNNVMLKGKPLVTRVWTPGLRVGAQ